MDMRALRDIIWCGSTASHTKRTRSSSTPRAHATEPPIDGLTDVPWLDNARILELDRLPGHLVVVGGGFIGCEFAQMFRRFGAEVTVIEPGRHLLGREDEEVSSALEEVFRMEDIRLKLENRAGH